MQGNARQRVDRMPEQASASRGDEGTSTLDIDFANPFVYGFQQPAQPLLV
jgi:hypothetical protein